MRKITSWQPLRYMVTLALKIHEIFQIFGTCQLYPPLLLIYFIFEADFLQTVVLSCPPMQGSPHVSSLIVLRLQAYTVAG